MLRFDKPWILRVYLWSTVGSEFCRFNGFSTILPRPESMIYEKIRPNHHRAWPNRSVNSYFISNLNSAYFKDPPET